MTVKYTQEHEWIQLEDHEAAVIGITLHAQDALGDVVFVDLPEAGREVEEGESIATVESVKAASDVYAPLAGTIVEANSTVADEPGLVNRSATDEGWFFKMELADRAAFDALMDQDAYDAFVASL